MPPKIVRILKEMSKGPFNTAKEGTSGAIEPVVHYFVPNTQQKRMTKISEQTDKAKEWIKDKIPSDDLVELFQAPVLIAESDYESIQTNSQMLDAQHLLTVQLEGMKKSKKATKNTPILFDYCENCMAVNNNKNDPPLDDPDEESKTEEDDITDDLQEQSEAHCCSQLTLNEAPDPAMSRRASLAPLSIPLPAPLPPPYQPALPVPRVWSKNHTTERLYRYTHIEGIIYPPGYVP